MKSGQADEAAKLRASVAADKDVIKNMETELSSAESQLQEILYKIPNVPAEKVPAGRSADDNITTKEWGKSSYALLATHSHTGSSLRNTTSSISNSA